MLSKVQSESAFVCLQYSVFYNLMVVAESLHTIHIPSPLKHWNDAVQEVTFRWH